MLKPPWQTAAAAWGPDLSPSPALDCTSAQLLPAMPVGRPSDLHAQALIPAQDTGQGGWACTDGTDLRNGQTEAGRLVPQLHFLAPPNPTSESTWNSCLIYQPLGSVPNLCPVSQGLAGQCPGLLCLEGGQAVCQGSHRVCSSQPPLTSGTTCVALSAGQSPQTESSCTELPRGRLTEHWGQGWPHPSPDVLPVLPSLAPTY